MLFAYPQDGQGRYGRQEQQSFHLTDALSDSEILSLIFCTPRLRVVVGLLLWLRELFLSQF